MPVILPREKWAAWLGEHEADADSCQVEVAPRLHAQSFGRRILTGSAAVAKARPLHETRQTKTAGR
jgi:hypothetical protein